MFKRIYLSGKYGTGKYALVDEEDYQRLNRTWWAGLNKGKYLYARRKGHKDGKPFIIHMHREVLSHITDWSGLTVDHIDGNTLNNQKSNLRACTVSDNCRNQGPRVTNKSGYKGVSQRAPGKWRAQICVNKKVKFLGEFTDPKTAALAYNKAARENFGKFGRTNQFGGYLGRA